MNKKYEIEKNDLNIRINKLTQKLKLLEDKSEQNQINDGSISQISPQINIKKSILKSNSASQNNSNSNSNVANVGSS